MTLNISDIKYKQEYEVISDPVQVNIFLTRILNSRVMLSATVSGHDDVFNSIIISIDHDKNQFLIDQLHPDHGHKKLLNKGKLTIFAGLDGIDLSFLCLLVDVDEKSGIPFYTLSFPQHIKHYQRRSSYRVKVIRSLSIPLKFTCPTGESFTGELDNMSSGGMRVRFGSKLPEILETGMIIARCEFDLPDEGPMTCSIVIRHIIHGEKGNQSYLGIQFENLNALDQRSINRFVTSLERELRRRSPT